MFFKLREDNQTNAAFELMSENDSIQDEAMVGSFWYDPHEKELFGIYSVYANDVPFTHSNSFNAEVRTGRRLHKDIWNKEFHKGKDKRFQIKNYTTIPRGRVFEFKDNKFVIFVGDWIDTYPEAKDLIIGEFNLPKDNIEFRKDVHWNIGHGWSDELL